MKQIAAKQGASAADCAAERGHSAPANAILTDAAAPGLDCARSSHRPCKRQHQPARVAIESLGPALAGTLPCPALRLPRVNGSTNSRVFSGTPRP